MKDLNNKYSIFAGFLFGLGLFLFVVMSFTTVWAFNNLGTTSTDPNVINVSPNFSFGKNDEDNTINDEIEFNVLVFKSEYYSSDGTSTVIAKSSNGDNIVAPGTEETGILTVKNTSQSKIATTLKFFIKGRVVFPIKVKLIDNNGKYLLGNTENYTDIENLNDVSTDCILEPGQSVYFSLPWIWAFETKDQTGSSSAGDSYDTSLGNLSSFDATFSIGLSAYSELIPKEGEYIYGIKTGDLIPWIIAVLVLLFLLTFVLYVISRKKIKQTSQNMSMSNNSIVANSQDKTNSHSKDNSSNRPLGK